MKRRLPRGNILHPKRTSLDDVNSLNLGSAVSLTVASNAVNAWDTYSQASVSTGVTVSAASRAMALAFDQLIEYSFVRSSYGTSAPVTITAIYK